MPPNRVEINRTDVLQGQLAVSFTRYLEKIVFREGEESDDVKAMRRGRKYIKERFKSSIFREHTDNILTMIQPAMDRYAEDLFKFLIEEMTNAGMLKKEGDNLCSAIPFEEVKRKSWLRKTLAKWKAPYRLD